MTALSSSTYHVGYTIAGRLASPKVLYARKASLMVSPAWTKTAERQRASFPHT